MATNDATTKNSTEATALNVVPALEPIASHGATDASTHSVSTHKHSGSIGIPSYFVRMGSMTSAPVGFSKAMAELIKSDDAPIRIVKARSGHVLGEETYIVLSFVLKNRTSIGKNTILKTDNYSMHQINDTSPQIIPISGAPNFREGNTF